MTTLRHVSDESPGIRRRRTGGGFVYLEPGGRRIRDAVTLDRIRALAIPPAWRDVWICPTPDGHMQAVGRDARGRKQYRYHRDWIAASDQAKYERMIAFGNALPKIRRRLAQDLKGPPLSRERVLATVVRLLEKTFIRVGNDEYARANHSYGLTTLRNHHVTVRGRRLAFAFRAKSGVYQHIALEDKELAKSVRRCQELPGQQLFEYVDAGGQLQSIGSADVNEYLRAFAGQEFTAKDFRTWAGTVLAASALSLMAHERPARSLVARKRHIVAAIDWVARALGNTRSVCRKGYVHPAVLDAYMAGVTLTLPKHADPGKAPVELLGDRAVERAVLSLLRQRRGPPRTDPGRSQSVQAVGRATEPVSSGYITSSLAARAREPSSGSSLATRRTDGVPAAVARSRQRVWGRGPMRTQ